MRKVKGVIGPLLVELNGEGKLFDCFCDEIDLIDSVQDNKPTDLIVTLVKRDLKLADYEPTYSSAKQHMTFNNDTFYYNQPVPFLCKNLFTGDTCELQISDNLKFDVKSLLKKLTSISINSRSELSYSLFWYVIQILLLRKGCSFIHAGILSCKDEAMLFMGTGGSGKTSTMFHLLDNPNYCYLAEDFGIISNKGETFLSPKTLSIYDSDIKSGTDILQNTSSILTISEKLRWLIYKSIFRKNPMKKIPIRSFFEKDKLGDTSNISKAFYILRTNSNKPDLYKADKEELADRLMNVTLREMKKFVELLNMINANAPTDHTYFTIDQFMKSTKAVYNAAFDEVDLFLLELPFKATPIEVEDFLKSKQLLI